MHLWQVPTWWSQSMSSTQWIHLLPNKRNWMSVGWHFSHYWSKFSIICKAWFPYSHYESLAFVEGCWGSLAVRVIGWFPYMIIEGHFWNLRLTEFEQFLAGFIGLTVAEGHSESLVCFHIKYLSRCGLLCVIVDRCASLWVVMGRCGSLWVVVGRCGSLWVVVGRWNRKQFYSNEPVADSRWGSLAVFVKLEVGFHMVVEGCWKFLTTLNDCQRPTTTIWKPTRTFSYFDLFFNSKKVKPKKCGFSNNMQ